MGRRAVRQLPDGSVEVRDLTADDRPLDDLTREAEVLSGRRVVSSGGVVLLGNDRFRAGWQELRRQQGDRRPPDPDRWNRQAALTALTRWQMGDRSQPERLAVAAWHLDRLIQAHPRDAGLREWKGEALAEREAWAEAEKELTAALDLGGTCWAMRGTARAPLGRWEDAAADLGRAPASDTNLQTDLAGLALARLKAGDAAGYREACTRLVRERPDELDPQFGGGLVVAALAAGPDALADWKPVLDVLDTPLDAEVPRDLFAPILDTDKALVLFRQGGRDEEVVRLLGVLEKRWQRELHALPPSVPWYFRAMANHRLKRAEDAGRDLRRAREERKGEPGRPGRHPFATGLASWQGRTIEELIDREASALIEGKRGG